MHYTKIQEARISGQEHYLGKSTSRAAWDAWQLLTPKEREGLAPQVAEEPLRHHAAWVERFYRGEWASSLKEGTISRPEYAACLLNLHSYVRYTTRLLGRAIECSPTTELREHFAGHLRGEVNHEILIERDLEALGEDVAWCRVRQPSAAARCFADIQWATIGHRADPVSFLACPLTAEGVSAAMTQAHIGGLRSAVSSWGLDPKGCTQFLASHIHFDSGEDGHHHQVGEMIRAHVLDEPTLQRFLGVQLPAQEAFLGAFEECMGVLWWT